MIWNPSVSVKLKIFYDFITEFFCHNSSSLFASKTKIEIELEEGCSKIKMNGHTAANQDLNRTSLVLIASQRDVPQI